MEDLAQRIGNILSDEESLKQIGELAAMLGLSDVPPPQPAEQKNTPALASGMDVGALMSLASKLKDFNPDDDNVRFLLALRPLLGEDKRIKIDKAVKILKLINILPLIKDSGLMGGDFFGIL